MSSKWREAPSSLSYEVLSFYPYYNLTTANWQDKWKEENKMLIIMKITFQDLEAVEVLLTCALNDECFQVFD